MPPTPEQTKLGYHRLWDRAKVIDTKRDDARRIAQRIIAHKVEYQDIEKLTGVPWFMIGVLHSRESSLNFKTHLHNGDSLQARTYRVPAGRPAKGNPPFGFVESAVDALTMAPHSLHKVKDWSLERMLYEQEKYNGWGYLGKGNSPYLWSWTSEYHGGKYVADGVYSASAWDQQAGTVALMKALAELDNSVAGRLVGRQTEPPKDVVSEATRKERTSIAVGTGVAGGGAATTQAPNKVAASWIGPLALAIGIALIVAACVLLWRKRASLLERWF